MKKTELVKVIRESLKKIMEEQSQLLNEGAVCDCPNHDFMVSNCSNCPGCCNYVADQLAKGRVIPTTYDGGMQNTSNIRMQR